MLASKPTVSQTVLSVSSPRDESMFLGSLLSKRDARECPLVSKQPSSEGVVEVVD